VAEKIREKLEEIRRKAEVAEVVKSEVIQVIPSIKKKVEQLCLECPNFTKLYYDECQEDCPIYNVCWELQDREDRVLEGAQKIMEITKDEENQG